jgi:nitrite reductase/ring-hydroxylating ferredoxin subunit
MVRLCRFDELTDGAARGFDPGQTGEDTMFVLRRGNAVRAYLNWCPHQGARLEYRKDRFLSADGQRVVCYAHGAHFEPETGVCVQGACLGQSLTSVPCHLEHGWVWICQRSAMFS